MEELFVRPLIGRKIPDLEFDIFHAGNIRKAKLADYSGKWLVLFFYPADFTFICPTELKEVAAAYPEFQKEGAEIVSVSTDTAFAHKAWHDESPAIGMVNFPMAADPSGAICRHFGTYIENEGLSYRASFVIDPEGTILAYEIHANSIGRSASELLRKLQAAKFVREHGGEVCPASWKPGAATLRPGVDLIGKI